MVSSCRRLPGSGPFRNGGGSQGPPGEVDQGLGGLERDLLDRGTRSTVPEGLEEAVRRGLPGELREHDVGVRGLLTGTEGFPDAVQLEAGRVVPV